MSKVELIAKDAAALEALVDIFEKLKLNQTSRIQGEDLALSKTIFQSVNTPRAVVFEISEFDYRRHEVILSPYLHQPVKADVIQKLAPELWPETANESDMKAAPISAASKPYMESEIPDGQNWYLYSINTCLQKFLTFKGRASRSEYAPYAITYSLLLLILDAWLRRQFPVEGLERPQKLMWLFIIAMVETIAAIPQLAAASRRLRDAGNSPWWLLLAFVPFANYALGFYLLLKKSKPAANSQPPQFEANRIL